MSLSEEFKPHRKDVIPKEHESVILEQVENWNLHFEKACESCKPESKEILHSDQRAELWLQLGVFAVSDRQTAPVEKREDNAAQCFYNGVKFMRMTPRDDSKMLTHFLKTFFDLIINGKLSYERAEPAIELAKDIFKYSYAHASAFWDCYRGFKKKLMKKKEPDVDPSEIQQEILKIFKEQFNYVHFKWVKNYEYFLNWMRSEKISDKFKIPIQQLYYNSISEADFLTENYKDMISPDNERHHSDFEEYIMNQIVPLNNLNRLAVVCQEVLNLHTCSPCYQMVYLKALCQQNFVAAMDDKRTLLNDAIQSGVTHAVPRNSIPDNPLSSVCDNAFNYYIQFALQAAVKFLRDNQILNIIKIIVNKYPLTHQQQTLEPFYVTRRNIIFALKDLVLAKKLPFEEMKSTFEDMMQPVTSSFFTLNEIPEEFLELNNYTFKLVELYKLWILCEKEARSLSWDEAIDMWCTTVELNHSPPMLLAYTEFVRQHGTFKQATKSYQEVIVKLEAENQDGPTSSYFTRKCYLRVLNNYLDLSMLHGKSDLELISQLSKLNADFYLRYAEKYDMQETQFDEIVGETYCPCLCHFNENVGKETPEHPSEKLKEESRKKGLPILELPCPWEEFEREEPNYPLPDTQEDHNDLGYPVFLSNLNYKATDLDVVDAFKEHNITVIRTNIRRNRLKNTNCGYGSIDLSCKEDQERALSNLDRIQILGRETFVSEHMPKRNVNRLPPSVTEQLPKRNVNRPPPSVTEPTVIIITGLSPEWTPVAVNNALAPYGHIKSVDVNDKLNPPAVRVEYVMFGDASVGYDKIKEGLIFKGETVKVRKGFAGSKRAHLKTKSPIVDPKVVPKQKTTKTDPKLKSEEEAVTDNEEEMPGPYVSKMMPRKSRRDTPRTLIPMQVIRKSRQELPPQPDATTIGEDQQDPKKDEEYSRYRNPETYSTTSPTSSSNSEDIVPPPKKLKNSDFREMLLRTNNTNKTNK